MKTILLIGLIVASSLVTAGEPDEKLHNLCIYPTMFVINSGPVEGITGSGVVVKSNKVEDGYENYVFTCAHVIRETPEIIVCDEDGKSIIRPTQFDYIVLAGVYENWSKLVAFKKYEVEIAFMNYEEDVAVLKFKSDQEMPIASIDTYVPVYLGNKVLKVGCGLDEPFRLDYGRITSLNSSVGKLEGLETRFRTSIFTVAGDSGGPVFHDYKLIGVMAAIRADAISYVIPLETFLKFEKVKQLLK